MNAAWPQAGQHRIVPESKRADMYGFLRREAQAGRQIYVVCPLIEESEAVDAKPAEEIYEFCARKR